MPHHNRSILTLLTSALAVLLCVTGCSSQSGASNVAVSEDAVVIDVRTADEYAAGHLDGAQLLDLNAGEFERAIPSLDPEVEYFVYCRSGNRSGQAVELLKQAGFENVTDLGAMEDAAESTGIAVVTE